MGRKSAARQKPKVKSRVPVPVSKVGMALVVILLFAVAGYLWTMPLRQERALHNASLAQLTDLANQDPNNGRVFYYLGLRQRELGQFAAAQDAFQQAALHGGQDDEDVWLAWAEASQSLNNDQNAVTVLRAFTKIHPDAERSHKALALLYMKWGNLTMTYSEALAAAKLAPRDTEAWRLAASAAFGTPNTSKERSEEAMRAAVKEDPNDWRNVHGLGQVLAAEQRDAEALAEFRQAYALQPNEPDTALSLGEMLLKHAMTQAQRAEARQALTRATALAPSSHLAWYLLGLCDSQSGQYAQARQALERSADLAPNESNVHFQLQIVDEKLGDAAAAAREVRLHAQLEADRLAKYKLQSYVHDHPNDLAIRLNFARFCAAHHDYPRAAYEYRHVIARDPSMEIAQREFAALERKVPPAALAPNGARDDIGGEAAALIETGSQ